VPIIEERNVPRARALAVVARARVPDRFVRHVVWLSMGVVVVLLRRLLAYKVALYHHRLDDGSSPEVLTVLDAHRRGRRSCFVSAAVDEVSRNAILV
jgi:hypothetical protein